MAVNVKQIKRQAPGGRQAKSGILDKEISILSRKFGVKKKTSFYRTLSLLTQAGLDTRSALQIISEESKSTKDQAVIQKLSQEVLSGSSLADAMSTSGVFGPYESESVRIGESSGQLLEVVYGLHAHFKRREALKRLVTKALSYPLFVLSVSFAVVGFMLSFVVPMFEGVFHRFGAELPKMTQLVIKLSAWFKSNSWMLLLAIVLLVGLAIFFRSNPTWSNLRTRIISRIPFFGRIYLDVYRARFCQAMHLLLESGNTLSKSLNMTAGMIQLPTFEKELKMAETDISKGASLYESMQKGDLATHRMCTLIKVGEESGKLSTVFEELSHQITDEVEHRSAIASGLLEPILIVFIALVIGFILVAMYLPLFELGKVIG